MKLITKKEFAEMAGINTKDLAVYILRHKVFTTGKLIDLDDKMNLFFLEDRRAKKNILGPIPENTEIEVKAPEKDEFDLSYLAIEFCDNALKEYSSELENEFLMFMKIQNPEVKALPLGCIVACYAGNIAEHGEECLKREISIYGPGISDEQKNKIKAYHTHRTIERMAFCKNEMNQLFKDIIET